MCCVYANPEAKPYQSIFVALYQMSVVLPGTSGDVLFTLGQVTKLPQ